MNCLFCKKISDNSKSVEHIIPESLGNKEHHLPKGIVCDECNNYFAIKIEKELLDLDYFKSVRSRNDITSKKGKPIPTKGIIAHPEGGIVDVYRDNSGISIDINNGRIVNLVKNGMVNKLYIPIEFEPPKNNVIVSRFLGKVALEALTQKFLPLEGWEEETIYRKELDPLRDYTRYGNNKTKLWQYHQRIIYSETDYFIDIHENTEPYEILHEFTFHYSEAKELFFVIAIMGIEYSINMAGPEIDSYIALLKKNGNKSFLSRDYEKRMNDE